MVRVHSLGDIGLLFGKYHWQLAVKISDLSFSKFPPKNCPIVHFVGESSLRLHTFVSAPLSWGGFIWKTRPGKIIFWMFISGGRDAQQLAHAPQHLLALRLRCQHGECDAHQECWEQKSREPFPSPIVNVDVSGEKIDTKSSHVILQINYSFWFQIGYAYGLMFLVAERYLYILNPQTHDWWGDHKTCVF